MRGSLGFCTQCFRLRLLLTYVHTYKLVVIYLNTLANYHLPNKVISLASYTYRK